MLDREVKVQIQLTPEDVALEFCNMDSKEQAQFFNELATLTAECESPFLMIAS